ncbi:uncharacterized protein LOC120534906 [Polypterus senegalus]|uniref:uncharacterized protein LOC120534906 n=1 Tax=Polypterus senegalus TaxID=55291 RepID=UPI001965E391|nr:uncharacterized protein LOC120534906 [Polypterus senegalus]
MAGKGAPGGLSCHRAHSKGGGDGGGPDCPPRKRKHLLFFFFIDENPLQNETVSQRESPELYNLSSPGVLTQLLDGSENLALYRNWLTPQKPPPSEISVEHSPTPSDSRGRHSPVRSDSSGRRLVHQVSPSPTTTHSDHGSWHRNRFSSRYSLRPIHKQRHRERLQELTENLGLLLKQFVELEAPMYNSAPEMCLHLMNLYAFYIVLI